MEFAGAEKIRLDDVNANGIDKVVSKVLVDEYCKVRFVLTGLQADFISERATHKAGRRPLL